MPLSLNNNCLSTAPFQSPIQVNSTSTEQNVSIQENFNVAISLKNRQSRTAFDSGGSRRTDSCMKNRFATRACLICDYSFSSAEKQWLYLQRILGQVVDKKQYTDEQIENFNWEDRCRLIQSDPVTCAMNFDYQVNQFRIDYECLTTRVQYNSTTHFVAGWITSLVWPQHNCTKS